MIGYLINQILMGKLTYQRIVKARPDLKSAMDQYIRDNDLEVIDKLV